MEHSDRKLNRLQNYDYSRNGLYFITICTKDRIPYLSEIYGVGNAAPYKRGYSVNHIDIEEICK